MADSLPSHNLEGRDVQLDVTANTGEGPGKRGRMLLSIFGPDGLVHYAFVVRPSSYLEAMALAVDAFHNLIVSTGRGVDDLVLKLAAKSSTGERIWATLRPEGWADVAQGYGEEIRVGSESTEMDDSQCPSPIVTFRPLDIRDRGISLKLLLPRTYEDAKNLAIKVFIGSNQATGPWHLRGALCSGGDKKSWNNVDILPSQWVPVVSKMATIDPTFEIWLVPGTGFFEGF